jgi:hypothetical protein
MDVHKDNDLINAPSLPISKFSLSLSLRLALVAQHLSMGAPEIPTCNGTLNLVSAPPSRQVSFVLFHNSRAVSNSQLPGRELYPKVLHQLNMADRAAAKKEEKQRYAPITSKEWL